MNVILEKEWHSTLFCLQGLGQIMDAPLAVCFVYVKGEKKALLKCEDPEFT